MEEAVIFEAAPAEERVEGVQALLALHRLGVWSVDVGGALGGQGPRKLLLRQLFVPAAQTTGKTGSARLTRLRVHNLQPQHTFTYRYIYPVYIKLQHRSGMDPCGSISSKGGGV